MPQARAAHHPRAASKNMNNAPEPKAAAATREWGQEAPDAMVRKRAPAARKARPRESMLGWSIFISGDFLFLSNVCLYLEFASVNSLSKLSAPVPSIRMFGVVSPSVSCLSVVLMKARPMHPIQMAAARTGLSPHVIRIWERRYGAVKPERDDSRRRLYSEEEIERLTLLRNATQAGHPIGTIAQLGAEQIGDLVDRARLAKSSQIVQAVDAGALFRTECLDAVKRLDAEALGQAFQRGLISLGHHGFLQVVVAPLAEEIGTHWRDGTITAAHEHFFTASAKVFLGHLGRQFTAQSGSPNLI